MTARQLTAGALSTAVVTVATMALRVPVPATQGYINLGETAIYLTALLLGPGYGLVAGGLGSALADLLGGYAQFALFTLVIKAVEGWLAGTLFWKVLRGPNYTGAAWVARVLVACGVAGLWMVAGYFVVEFFFLGLGLAAAAEVPGNLFQVMSGLVVGLAGSSILRRAVTPPQ